MQAPSPLSVFFFLKHRFWVMAMTAMLCLNTHASEFTPQALIEKSGLGIHLDFIPKSLKIGIEHAMKNGVLKLSVEQIRQAHAAFEHAYAPSKLRAAVAERIPARITPEQGSRIITFLESPLGRRVVERENRLAQPEIQSEIQQNAAKIIADAGKNASRLALYASLVDAMDSTRHGVDIYIGSALATNAAILATLPDTPERPTLEEIRKNLDAQRLAITATMSQTLLSNTAYAYQDLSEAELNDYLQFALSPEGKVYFQELGNILSEVLVMCAYDAGKFSAENKLAPI